MKIMKNHRKNILALCFFRGYCDLSIEMGFSVRQYICLDVGGLL